MLKSKTMQTIYEKLGLNKENGLLFSTDIINSELFPYRVSHVLHNQIKPDALYILDGKIIISFFNLAIEHTSDEKEKIFKNCWNFNESPIVILNLPNGSYEIYNGFKYIVSNKALEKLDDSNIDYISIVTGKIWEHHKHHLKQENRVDSFLLKNIKDARNQLLQQGISKKVANTLIGRTIFIRYLIDRKICILSEFGKKALTNEDLKIILSSKKDAYDLFKYIKKQFNGDVFPILEDEQDISDTDLLILKNLVSGTELSTGQMSLFDIYDFSIIPIEFISNIYEYFIGKEEQESKGAYYTPTFLVDYTLKNTIDIYFEKNPNSFNCPILDPACGSGIFLVEALRKLIARYINIDYHNPKSNKFKEGIKQLLKDNIFGIDKDGDAIMVTIFSLCITLLDYQDPKEIEDFKFPNLLHTNFFEADFFDVNASFNERLLEINPKFIVGNPPYKRGGGSNEFVTSYIKKRSQKESKKISISNKEIAQAFLIRVNDFCTQDTVVSFIITSKILYNLQAKEFRYYFLENFFISHILELSSVRGEIFNKSNDKAVTPVALIIYKPSFKKNTTTNSIQYISVKPSPAFSAIKMLMIQKSDYKVIKQALLIENDWLWKVLVYGSYLDFNFLKRLKELPTIDQNITSRAGGIIVGGGDKNDASMYLGLPYITTEDLKQQDSLFNIQKTWMEPIAHRAKNLELFRGPSLLIGKGISSDLTFNCKIQNETAIFADSITAIKAPIEKLERMYNIFKSDLAKYFIFHTASSIGIEREQVHSEKFQIPFFHDDYYMSDKEKSLMDYTLSISIPWIIQHNHKRAFQALSNESENIKQYINLFFDAFNIIYKQSNKHLNAEVYYHPNVIGIFFKVISTQEESKILWYTDQSIQKFITFAGTHYTEKLFVQRDVKGFEANGFYVVKPNEYKNWHTALSYQDIQEFKDAILKAGMEHV